MNSIEALVRHGQETGMSEEQMQAEITALVQKAEPREYLEYILTGLIERVFAGKSIFGMIVIGFERNPDDGHDYPMEGLVIGEIGPLIADQNIDLAIAELRRMKSRLQVQNQGAETQ
ncbi:hypothetical protein JKG47_10100 [Acidithiobacillus sp. MC6.1]|nr:hypothetical protein [Acidithiobacillus sp. MC6.1]